MLFKGWLKAIAICIVVAGIIVLIARSCVIK